MTLTRWKLMAGVFGLSMCGLAALAEPACRTVGYAHRQAPAPLPLPEPGGKPTPPPLDVAPPTPAPLPLVSKVDAPPPATEVPAPSPLPLPGVTQPEPKSPAPADFKPSLPMLPAVATAPAPSPTPTLPPIGEPKVVAGGMDEKSFVDLAKQQLKLPELPTLEKKDEKKPDPLPRSTTITSREPYPATALPATQPVPAPIPFSELPPATVPVKAEVPPAPSQLTPRSVETTPSEPVRVSTTVTAERKLKVQLHLGGGKPWFEVRDGEELVLKVVSDAIEVKAPAENGDAASVLKASGSVSFRTLGANGTCDELRVIPGTGEVVVIGRVAVTSNWGKAETTATADRMTFKLGGQVLGMSK